MCLSARADSGRRRAPACQSVYATHLVLLQLLGGLSLDPPGGAPPLAGGANEVRVRSDRAAGREHLQDLVVRRQQYLPAAPSVEVRVEGVDHGGRVRSETGTARIAAAPAPLVGLITAPA